MVAFNVPLLKIIYIESPEKVLDLQMILEESLLICWTALEVSGSIKNVW